MLTHANTEAAYSSRPCLKVPGVISMQKLALWPRYDLAGLRFAPALPEAHRAVFLAAAPEARVGGGGWANVGASVGGGAWAGGTLAGTAAKVERVAAVLGAAGLSDEGFYFSTSPAFANCTSLGWPSPDWRHNAPEATRTAAAGLLI